MTDTKKTLYLIDGSAYIYRGYHALPPLSNSKGLPTNAILGYLNIISKLMNDRKPDYAAVCFDVKGPTFRHELYKEYKANRPPMPDDLSMQIPYIRKLTTAYNIPVFELQGYEADDVIGTLAKKAESEGFEVVMVTGDKDYMQLVSDNILMFDPMKDVVLDPEAVKEKTGVFPEQIVDIMALTGDKSDNIPGVPGIGQKTAPVLINEFGSLEKLYDKVDTITKKKQKENLINHKDDAYLSKDLVTIDTDSPVEFNVDSMKVGEPDGDRLYELFRDLEFKKYIQDFKKEKETHEKTYKAILKKEELEELVNRLEKEDIFAVDTETTSLNPHVAKLVGLSFSAKAHEAFYVPCGHRYIGAPEQIPMDEVLEMLRPLLEGDSVKKTGQNIKYDMIVLERHGIKLGGVAFDTMLASYLINPSQRSHGLDQIALDLFDHQNIKYEEVAGKGKSAIGFEEVTIEKATPYACEDADITFMAYEVLSDGLKEAGLTELFHNVEMPLMPVLMKMEMEGIAVDENKLTDLSKMFESEMVNIEKDIYSIAGEEFNINSSQQLGHILFEKLELPVQKKTKKKTGYSTDVAVLTALSEMHELPALILRYRSISKLKSTYTDALLELVNSETGRIHTSFNQTGTVTGRLSSSDPNLQNIPVRTDEGKEIRRAFVPRKGWKLISADYSQIELRLLAHCSEDKILIDSYVKDKDIHATTAEEVFEVFPSFVTDELRRQAKAINFGIMYGMSAFRLSNELGITQKMAKKYIDNYFARYSGVKEFIEKTIQTAEDSGKTSTLLGRVRFLADIRSSNRNVKQAAERAAVNTPIQGTAADLIKLAMINADKVIEEKGLKTRMLLSVHDEIVFEVPEDEMDEVAVLVKEVMENVWELKVPLKVNLETGDNWAEAH